MIEYTTKNGTNVKIELENAEVKNLIVNDIEIVKDRTKRDMSVFVTSFDNTIVLNSSRLYKKLGANQIVRIMASDELMEEYHKQYKQILKSQEEERNRILNRTNKKSYYDFNMHMNDINADLIEV